MPLAQCSEAMFPAGRTSHIGRRSPTFGCTLARRTPTKRVCASASIVVSVRTCVNESQSALFPGKIKFDAALAYRSRRYRRQEHAVTLCEFEMARICGERRSKSARLRSKAPAGRQCGDRRYDEGKAIGEVVTVPRDKAHAGSVAPSDDAEAAILDFVNPAGGGAHLN